MTEAYEIMQCGESECTILQHKHRGVSNESDWQDIYDGQKLNTLHITLCDSIHKASIRILISLSRYHCTWQNHVI